VPRIDGPLDEKFTYKGESVRQEKLLHIDLGQDAGKGFTGVQPILQGLAMGLY
jgi:hypothetical protein